jgi:hypothetical protein
VGGGRLYSGGGEVLVMKRKWREEWFGEVFCVEDRWVLELTSARWRVHPYSKGPILLIPMTALWDFI